MQTHSPEEFLSRLSSGQLSQPIPLSVVGMVKAGDIAGSLEFTTAGCEKWLSLPIGAVESLTHIRDVPCKEHQHPLAVVKFKPVSELSTDVAFFVGLSMQLQDAARRASSRATASGGRERSHLASDCAIVQGEGGLSIGVKPSRAASAAAGRLRSPRHWILTPPRRRSPQWPLRWPPGPRRRARPASRSGIVDRSAGRAPRCPSWRPERRSVPLVEASPLA